ncbi:MAG: carbohydrate-binding protein [Streptomyces sp.]|nr:carbohydrate-binding protein [Streptomyces sp.]
MPPRPHAVRHVLRPFTCVLALLPGGVTAAAVPASAAPAPRSAPAAIPPSDYQQVQLATGPDELGEPMSLTVLPDRSVLHTARDGTVRITDAVGNTKVAGKLDVYTHDEEGLQGIAADPGFATNRYVWVYYSPKLATPAGDAPTTGTAAGFERWKGHLNLSRFTLKSDGTLDPGSEKVALEVANDRGQCCHVGGDIDFDKDGNLYLTTGDDTNPFESSGYVPPDERTDRNPQFDAQRSAGNTNDLRGKLLRIKPTAAGGYTIPSGNLFAPGTANTRPEIYAMGFRNPFRTSVDKPTGTVYLGDYGPDAGSTDSNRGPSGQVEFDRTTGPGNFGWPYCTGTNTTTETYTEYTFPSGPSGAKYDCAGGPANNSFRNTGLPKLPAAKPSWIRYGGDAGSPPEFGTGSESGSGVQIASHAPASGGQTLGYIDNGDWAGYSTVPTAGAARFSARVSSAGAGGTIDIRAGSATGPVLGSVTVPGTGGWETFTTVATDVNAGASPLYLTFRGGSGSLFDVDTVTVTYRTTALPRKEPFPPPLRRARTSAGSDSA